MEKTSRSLEHLDNKITIYRNNLVKAFKSKPSAVSQLLMHLQKTWGVAEILAVLANANLVLKMRTKK